MLVILGEEELATGCVTLKDLEASTELVVPEDEVAKIVLQKSNVA